MSFSLGCLEAEASFSTLYFYNLWLTKVMIIDLRRVRHAYMGSMVCICYLRLFFMLTVLLISSVVTFCGSPTSWPSSWSARGHEEVARRHTCFGLTKVSVVLIGVLPSEMGSSYCISAASCEERQWREK